MAAALEEKKDFVTKFGSQVDEQIAQATSRIRIHDLTLGSLTLAALVAIYATTMILLDKSFALPEWVRQLSLAAFLAGFGVVAYLLVIRPLRARINPLYAAARVEETVDNAKNSVTGYVEVMEKGDVHIAVKTAMSAKAAKAVGEADVNRAVDHRNLLIAGGVLVAFLLTLVVLFFIFRPTQFSSLMSRAFVPFTSDPIATRTQLTLLKPNPADVTLTTGQTIAVAVHVGGKVPSKDSPTRVRLLLRHNPADPNYEELPMEEGETSRDWHLKVPEYLVHNGFWYKVAGGDDETAEHKVTVRSLPLFTDFEATFQYPEYTRIPPAKSSDANFRAYRGTQVTLTARANRDVKTATMAFEAANLAPVIGKPVLGKPDSVAFTFTATEATRYRLNMISTADEKNADPPPFTITIDSDQPPTVIITNPEAVPDQPEATAPANAQLSVDGTVGDDFGIDKARLRLRVDGRDLAPIPFMGGKSFFRKTDKSWPTDLAYKDSADFTKLTYADGAKFEPKEGMVVEYWLEAIDNCTETKPVEGWGEKPQPGNVGRSNVQKLRLTPPQVAEDQKQQLDQQKEQRRNDEKQHNQQQQQELDDQKRDPKQPPEGQQPQQQNENQKQDNPQPKEGDANSQKDPNNTGKNGSERTPERKDNANPPKNAPAEKNQDGTGGQKNSEPGMKNADPNATPPEQSPNEPKKSDMPPNNGMGGAGEKPPEPVPPPMNPEDKKAEEDARKEAERVQEQIDKNKAQGGEAKPNPSGSAEQERTPPAKSKPMSGDAGQDSPPKEAPKPNDATNPPMGKDQSSGSSKSEGQAQQPTPTNDPKPQPDDKAKPSENRDAPLGGSAGQDKASPEPKKGDNQPNPKDQPKNQDAGSGSTGKPAGEKQEGDTGPNEQPKNPAENAGAAKPNNDPTRGTDKPSGQSKGSQPQETQPKENPNAAKGKPEQAPRAGAKKPAPSSDPMGGKAPDASESKETMNPNGGDGAAQTKKPPQPPMGGGAGTEKSSEPGQDKGDSQNQQQAGGKPNELTEKQKKELEDAARDLNSPDPTKREAAEKKLDKTIGEKSRKEAQQLAKDLQSNDETIRKAAEQKLDELKKQAAENAKNQDAGNKPSEKDIAELKEKLQDLNSKDDAKRQAAEKSFDEKLGKDQREKIQEELRKQAEEATKQGDMGKEPKLTEQEIRELQEKARDLDSKDEAKRQEAEKLFDEKLGKEARERVQAEAKKRNEEFHKQIAGRDTEPPLPAADADPRNKAKTTELQLQEFEKHRNDKDLQEKLGWPPGKYDEFLEAQRKRVEQLQKEAARHEETLRNPSSPPGTPTLNADGGRKLDTRSKAESGTSGTGTGAVYAPPGFEDAKTKFTDAAKKLLPKK